MHDTDPNDSEVIMPDEVRPALADVERDLSDDELSGQDLFEDETLAGIVIRPTGDA